MRRFAEKGGFSVTAISGTYVVMLGINTKETATKGLLGFAINRRDHTENEQYWLRGFKTFEETEPDPIPGALYSTLEHPVQSFLWGDYTAKTEHKYTYKVVSLYGKPKNLQQGSELEVKIDTESEDTGVHAVYFNRGVAGSQAYYAKFKNKKPEEVEEKKAFFWLSRGLEEAMLRFIAQANGPEYGLRAALYEFNYLPALHAFGEAANQGADVKIVYDSRRENPREANDKAIETAGIKDLTIRRTRPKSYISHNKFIVLLKSKKPQEVWTGSTNITTGGIFGQCNTGHIVRDEQVAQKFQEYWNQLERDPTMGHLREWVDAETPDPQGTTKPGITPLFSPRKTLDALGWYSERMDEAKEMVCLAAAFGVNPLLAEVLSQEKEYLRYLLLEKKGGNYDVLSRDPDVQIAIGSHLSEGALFRWAREKLTEYNFHVKYIHNKFMLLDPLSHSPTVITGSANFSEASTRNNDENMLVIQGDTRVADIYLGEFFRLFNHFYFRYVVNNQKSEIGSEEKKRSYLKPDDSWTEKYYVPGSAKEKQRLLFGRDLS